jgi:hypothetical protein
MRNVIVFVLKMPSRCVSFHASGAIAGKKASQANAWPISVTINLSASGNAC